MQAVPLITWPRLIISFLTIDTPEQQLVQSAAAASGVDVYLARSLGLALVALGLINLILSGTLPLGTEDCKHASCSTPIHTPTPL